MGKKHFEVRKDGFITVYPDLNEPRHGCRLQDLVAGVVKWLRRVRKSWRTLDRGNDNEEEKYTVNCNRHITAGISNQLFCRRNNNHKWQAGYQRRWIYSYTYLALVIIAAVLVILIPSVFILAVVFLIISVILIMLFFPLMPIAFLLLPGIILAGIVYLVYRLVKKKK